MGTAVDLATDVLSETGMRKYAARRMGRRFMQIEHASVRKLAKQQLYDNVTFTTRDALKREEELLAYDNLSFNNSVWSDDDEAEHSKDK